MTGEKRPTKLKSSTTVLHMTRPSYRALVRLKYPQDRQLSTTLISLPPMTLSLVNPQLWVGLPKLLQFKSQTSWECLLSTWLQTTTQALSQTMASSNWSSSSRLVTFLGLSQHLVDLLILADVSHHTTQMLSNTLNWWTNTCRVQTLTQSLTSIYRLGCTLWPNVWLAKTWLMEYPETTT